MAELYFDATDIEPTNTFELIPVGEYTVIVTDSDIKDTKSGNGQYLFLVYDIIDGKYKGRKIFDRINIKNQNETTQVIAQQRLSAICRSVGIMKIPGRTEELHDKPFIIKLGIEPASEKYEAQNKVKGYKPLGDIQKQVSGVASTKPPWE